MKTFSVTFNVQADTLDEAIQQACAYVRSPSHAPIVSTKRSRRVTDAHDAAFPPLPHLDMTACKTCGRKLIDDGWVQFCNEECMGRHHE